MARFWKGLQTVFNLSKQDSTFCSPWVPRKVGLAFYQVHPLHLKTSETPENLQRNLPDLFRQNHHPTFSKRIRFLYWAFKIAKVSDSGYFILTGKRISKMDPFGRLFLTIILPFSVSKICLANERPNPKPPFCRVLALSTR